MRVLVLVLVGAAVGYCSGTLGIGGGVLLIPALMYCCAFEQGRAAGTSLAVLSIPVLLPATLKAHGQGRVELDAVGWLAGSFALGSYLGAACLPSLPTGLPPVVLGSLLIVLGARLLVQTDLMATWVAGALIAVWVWTKLLAPPGAPEPTQIDYCI